jgi:vitamin B12 transporter
MNCFRFTPLLAALAAVAAISAQAASSPETIIVTATRQSEPVEQVTRDVSLISRAFIEQSSATSLAELLALVGGVSFTSNGNSGAASGVFLRGANTNHTLVLIDGQRASSSTAGTTTLEAIPLSSIDRIEIVRGPHSAFYGADALGGVVHVFTRASTAPGIALSGGTDNTMRAEARFGAQANNVSYGISGSWEKSDGFNAVTNPQNFAYNADRDGYRRASVQANIRANPSTNVEYAARVFHNDLDTQYDGGADFDDRARTKVSGVTFSVRWSNTQAQVGVSQDDARFISAFPATFRTRHTEASLQHTLALSSNIQASGIIEARDERIASSEAFVTDSRRTISAVARLTGKAQSLQWNVAARVDDSNQFDTRLTASGGAKWALTREIALVANVGTAFKAPTFNDLYYPGFSNPLLRPERAMGADFGLRSTYGATNWSVIAHHARVKDLIVFQCDADFNCLPQNVNRARTDGVTFSVQHRVSNLALVRASLDVQKPENEATGGLLPRRAQTFGSVFASHRFGAVNTFVTVSGSGRRFDDGASTRRLAGYARVDLGADWDLSSQWRLEARIRNVADRAIVLASDFATPGREASLGIRWNGL